MDADWQACSAIMQPGRSCGACLHGEAASSNRQQALRPCRHRFQHLLLLLLLLLMMLFSDAISAAGTRKLGAARHRCCGSLCTCALPHRDSAAGAHCEPCRKKCYAEN